MAIINPFKLITMNDRPGILGTLGESWERARGTDAYTQAAELTEAPSKTVHTMSRRVALGAIAAAVVVAPTSLSAAPKGPKGRLRKPAEAPIPEPTPEVAPPVPKMTASTRPLEANMEEVIPDFREAALTFNGETPQRFRDAGHKPQIDPTGFSSHLAVRHFSGEGFPLGSYFPFAHGGQQAHRPDGGLVSAKTGFAFEPVDSVQLTMDIFNPNTGKYDRVQLDGLRQRDGQVSQLMQLTDGTTIMMVQPEPLFHGAPTLDDGGYSYMDSLRSSRHLDTKGLRGTLVIGNTNNADSWEAITLEDESFGPYILTGVAILNKGHLLASHAGGLVRTYDNGQTWEKVDLPSWEEEWQDSDSAPALWSTRIEQAENADPHHIKLSCVFEDGSELIYKSTSGGEEWTIDHVRHGKRLEGTSKIDLDHPFAWELVRRNNQLQIQVKGVTDGLQNESTIMRAVTIAEVGDDTTTPFWEIRIDQSGTRAIIMVNTTVRGQQKGKPYMNHVFMATLDPQSPTLAVKEIQVDGAAVSRMGFAGADLVGTLEESREGGYPHGSSFFTISADEAWGE